MRVDGPGGRRSKKEELERMQIITEFMTGGVVKVKKQRKERAKETGPRNQVEAALRKDVKKWLSKHGWRWWRIENAICGKSSGLPDFIIAKDKMIFVELKGTGGLTGLQPEFQEHCQRCGMPHMVVRSVEELEKGLK